MEAGAVPLSLSKDVADSGSGSVAWVWRAGDNLWVRAVCIIASAKKAQRLRSVSEYTAVGMTFTHESKLQIVCRP